MHSIVETSSAPSPLRRRHGRRWALKSALLLALASSRASATTVVATTLEALALRSDAVIVGRVVETRVLSRRGRLSTDVDLLVLTCLRGALRSQQRVTLRVPGGATSTVVEEVFGVPDLRVGDSVVTFLSLADASDPSRYYLAHLTAAIAVLSVDARGEVVVGRAPHGAIVAESAGPLSSRTVLRRSATPLRILAAAVGASR